MVLVSASSLLFPSPTLQAGTSSESWGEVLRMSLRRQGSVCVHAEPASVQCWHLTRTGADVWETETHWQRWRSFQKCLWCVLFSQCRNTDIAVCYCRAQLPLPNTVATTSLLSCVLWEFKAPVLQEVKSLIPVRQVGKHLDTSAPQGWDCTSQKVKRPGFLVLAMLVYQIALACVAVSCLQKRFCSRTWVGIWQIGVGALLTPVH